MGLSMEIRAVVRIEATRSVRMDKLVPLLDAPRSPSRRLRDERSPCSEPSDAARGVAGR